MLGISNYLLLAGIALLLGSCLPNEELKEPFNHAPRIIDDGWTVATPSEMGFNPTKFECALKPFFHQDTFLLGQSLLVIKDGILVAEAYAENAAYPEDLHNIKSATKSVTSLLVGCALRKGILDSVNQTIETFFPEYAAQFPDIKSISLHHLLTMTSGLKWSNTTDTWPLMTSAKDNSLEDALSRPLVHAPGEAFSYTDAQPHIVSGILGKLTGSSLEAFAQEHLFTPLGIDEYYWEKHNDGTTYGAVALYLKPRDFAKIGLLALQEGHWAGKQLIDSSWIAESVRPLANQQTARPYGYYWWIRPEMEAYTAIGHGGQCGQ